MYSSFGVRLLLAVLGLTRSKHNALSLMILHSHLLLILTPYHLFLMVSEFFIWAQLRDEPGRANEEPGLTFTIGVFINFVFSSLSLHSFSICILLLFSYIDYYFHTILWVQSKNNQIFIEFILNTYQYVVYLFKSPIRFSILMLPGRDFAIKSPVVQYLILKYICSAFSM